MNTVRNDTARALDEACKRLQEAIAVHRINKTVIAKKGATLYSVRNITVKA